MKKNYLKAKKLAAGLCALAATLATHVEAQPQCYFTTNVATSGTYSWDAVNWGTNSVGTYPYSWTNGGFARFYGTAAANYTVTVNGDEQNVGLYNHTAAATLTITNLSGAGDLRILTTGGTPVSSNLVQGILCSGPITIYAPIVGSAGIEPELGTLSLYGNNTYSGGTYVGGSLVNFNNNNSFGSGTITLGSVGTSATSPSVSGLLSIGGSLITLPNYWLCTNAFSGVNFGSAASTPVTCSGNWNMQQTLYLKNNGDATAPLTVSGTMFGPGGLTVFANNSGLITLSGPNTFTGPVTIGQVGESSVVTLSVSSINKVSGGAASSSLGAPTTVANGTINMGALTHAGNLVYTGVGETSDRVINLSGTTGGATIENDGSGALVFTSNLTATTNGAKTLTLQGTSTANNTFSGSIVDSGSGATSLTKAQAGTWVLSGVNTFSGNTTISGGTLTISGSGSLKSGNYAGTIANAGTFNYNSSAAQSLSGTISGAGPINVGGGTLTQSAAATAYTGLWSINSGLLVYGSDANLGAVPGSTVANAITLNGGTFGNFGLRVSGGSPVLNSKRGITLGANGGAVQSAGGATFIYGGIISGSGSFESGTSPQNGNGTNLLSGANTYTGATIIADGTLQLGANGTLPSGTPMIIASATSGGATPNLYLNTFNQTIGWLTSSNGAGAAAGLTPTITLGSGALTINETASTTFAGNFFGGSASSVILNATGQTLTLTGTNSSTGSFNITSGTLALSGNATNPACSFKLGSGATLDVSGLNSSLTLNAGISTTNTGSTTTSTINLSSTAGAVLSASGMSFTAYGGGSTAPITVSGAAGSLNLNSAPVTVNATALLAPGTNILIAASGGATVSGTPGTVTITGLGSSTGASLQIDGSGNLDLVLTPTIVGSATTTAFTTTYGTASAAQSFPVSGDYLTANIVATAPTGYEVSSDGVNFNPTATFTETSGTASGTLYVRIAAASPVTGSYDSAAVALTSAGATTINITSPSSGDSVTPAALSITATGATINYTGTGFSGGNGVSYSAFVGSDSPSSLTGTLVYVGTSQNATNVGSYSIVPAGLSDPNYNITFNPGTLTIQAVSLSITATNAVMTYSGSAFNGGGVTYSGLVGSDTSSSLTGTLSFGGTAQGAINAGSYTIIPSGLSDANYNITYNNGSLTISPAGLSITANNASTNYNGIAYSGGNGVTYSGFVGTDTNTTLTGTLSYGGTSQGAIAPGSYSIIPSGLSDANYNITFNPGTLTINQATPSFTLTSSENPSGYYDSLTFVATNFPSDATSNVVFSANAVPFSTNTLAGAGATSLAITNLPRGTNVITAIYSGDANYVTVTMSLNQVVTNHPPVASPVSYTRNSSSPELTIAITNLLSNATDADGDTISLVGVSASTNGITLTTNGMNLVYYNTNAVVDQFTYTVIDSYGDTNSATVTINISTAPLFGPSIPTISSGGPGSSATLNYAGIPNYTYSIARSTNMLTWQVIWTTNCPASGLFQFTDPVPPVAGAFYQLQYNP